VILVMPGEEIVATQDGAKLEGVGKGVLYLTNRRLMFEKVSGLISKKYQVAMEINLVDLTHVGVRGGKLIVEAGGARHIVEVKNPESWERAVENAMLTALKAAPKPVAPTMPQPQLSPFLTPTTALAFCPSCGARLPVDSMFCPSCGRRVK